MAPEPTVAPSQPTAARATHPQAAASGPQLPVTIASPADVGRLLRELQNVDEQMLQLGLRQPGGTVSLPRVSQLLEATVQLNKVNLLQPDDRQRLQAALNGLKDSAPRLHISFSSDPSPDFLEKLMAWLRREIHPQMLVTIGLQPNLAAGCVLRSTNRYFDLSLRQEFINKRDLLVQQLDSVLSAAAGPPAAAPAPVAAEARA